MMIVLTRSNRKRKIRCCGGLPCRNCTRSHRECDYSPVPEEVNRATRERKAIAKASKSSPSPAPSSYSQFFGETPVYNVPYVSGPPARPSHLGHRRSVSVPNFDFAHWVVPPAPAFQSPAMLESSQWMYNGWSYAPAMPVQEQVQQTHNFPSVLEQPPTQENYLPSHYAPATPTDSRSSSTDSDGQLNTSWSMPNVASSYLRPPMPLTPLSTKSHHRAVSHHSPITPANLYHNYQPVFSPSPLTQSISPTLAPEMSMSHKDLVGLGIGGNDDVYPTPTFLPEEYFASPQF